MIKLSDAAPWFVMVTTIVAAGAPSFAQQPTEAQRDAIRSECRSDYEAHCASVPPGGAASLQCLEKNMSSLSAACQRAVKAVEPAPAAAAAPAAPAAPKAEEAAKPAAPAAAAAPAPAKAAAPAAPAAAPKAAGSAPKAPSTAQLNAIRSACRSDYPKVCAGVPAGGEAALQCLEKNKAKVSKGCEQAVNAVGGGAAPTAAAAPASGGAPAAAPAAAAAAPAPTVLVLRPMLPREELAVLRICGGDVRTLCGAVAPGGGRIVQCLANRAASISPACQDVLSQFRVAQ